MSQFNRGHLRYLPAETKSVIWRVPKQEVGAGGDPVVAELVHGCR
jgi:hypothetical protein